MNPQPAFKGKPALLLKTIFPGLFGIFLGLTLLKFGNPVIMAKYFTLPGNIYEWVFNSWPEQMGMLMLVVVTVSGIFSAHWKVSVPRWLIIAPSLWLLWNVAAASHSAYPSISWPTVFHFSACVVCFYLGLFALGPVKNPRWFWIFVIVGLALVVASGLQQHFGGLELTRKYWLQYIYPTEREIPPGFAKKMMSNRIFATLFYPNTLAGVILLLLPITMAVLWSMREQFTSGARALLMGIFAVGALACLFWSGSKGGWLIMLVMILVAGTWLPLKFRTKVGIAGIILVLGLSGFFIKYLVFFEKGATSVVARFDYWSAALQTGCKNPLFGTGPGTFGKAYEILKRPESEMAQLAHNDYLEQACDSGLIGFLLFSFFLIGTMYYAWRYARLDADWVRLAVWLGLFAWAIQSFFEFGLYIPATSWTSFTLLGWLLAQCGNEIDSRK